MKFNSLKSRLIIALLLIVLLPTITIGWLAHEMMSDYIMSEKITHVGRVAEAKHEQLIMALTRANSKAKLLLSDLSKQCGGNKLNHICAAGLINAYLGAEGAIGANLYNNTRDDNLIIGDSEVKGKTSFTFQTGQLAKFSSTGATSKHSYFISIVDESFRLTITYPSSLLAPIFNPPPKDLELSGEAFLADGEGYFVTPPRYATKQGLTLPISARPMQTCLGGQSHEALDLDYRGVAVIHGFRFVPEFGQACIMAHITQEEAFAPLKRLKQRLILILFLFCTTLFVTIIYLARSIVKPITDLKGVTRAIAAGDYRVKAEVSGSDEVSSLATSFNLMTNRLMQSERTLKEAQQLAHLGSWERDLMANSFICSEEVLRILEIDPKHKGISYETFILTVHPDDREMVDRAYLTCLQTHEPFNIEHRILLANGRVKWVNEYGIFHCDANGVPLRSVGTIQDITERKLSEENIHHLAFYDQLTHLPNRLLLLDRLKNALKSSTRSREYCAILLIDLDNFKLINDTRGHDFGDQLLIEVAHRLQSCVLEGDTVANTGGDEFVVILENMNDQIERAAAQTQEVGEEILAAISRPYLIKEQEIRCTASIGISLFMDRSATADSLIKNVNIAMNQAKISGRNNLRFFDPDMQADLDARAALESDLHRALTSRQFILYYQPQLDLRTGHLGGVEALVRWKHPERGLVSPLEFIPIAEETGLIVPLGDWVLQEACRQLAEWRAGGIKHVKMSVNLAAKQFSDKNLPARIRELMVRYKLPADSIDLEVTESMTMGSPSEAIEMMNVLTGQGHSMSIDDFGTGYSSLAYLKLFPISTLKIDRSFVKDIETDPNDAIICDITVLLAHKLGMKVVAEGVETEAQLKYLLSIGCEKIQGYLISKPLPADQAENFIRNNQHMASLGTIDLWE